MHEERLILTSASASWLERLEPRVKLLCLVVWVVCVVSVPPGEYGAVGLYALLLGMLLAANWRLGGKFLRRLAPALPPIIFAALFLPFLRSGEAWARVGPLVASRPGVETGLRVAAIGTLCAGGVALVWASTRQDLLLQGLRGIGLPAMFINVLGFMLRYLEILRPELHRLTDACAARTIGRQGPNPLRTSANLVGVLFVRAHDRAERVADAMAARGYAGTRRTFHTPHFHVRDVICGLLFVSVVIAARLAGKYL